MLFLAETCNILRIDTFYNCRNFIDYQIDNFVLYSTFLFIDLVLGLV